MRLQPFNKNFNDPTEEFLILCISPEAGKPVNKLREAIRTRINWEMLINIACENNVAVLLYSTFKKYGLTAIVPEDKLDILRALYLASDTNNNFYKEELKKILSIFYENNIPIIPLKGMALSQRLYGDVVKRGRSVDQDFLIKEEDRRHAFTLLEAMGYAFKDNGEIEAWQWASVFTKPQAKMIELHWDITMMARNDLRIMELWNGTALIDWEGIKYHDFLPEELLLYLSAHLVNSDSFRQIKYIYDISVLIIKCKHDINWERLVEKSRKWKLAGCLYAALKLSKDLFEVDLPKNIFKGLGISLQKRFFIGYLANKKIYFKKGIRRKMLDRFLSYILFELVTADSVSDYVAICKRLIFPPRKVLGHRGYIMRALKGIYKVFK